MYAHTRGRNLGKYVSNSRCTLITTLHEACVSQLSRNNCTPAHLLQVSAAVYTLDIDCLTDL